MTIELEAFGDDERAYRAFAAAEIEPHAAWIDREEHIPPAVIRALADRGFLGFLRRWEDRPVRMRIPWRPRSGTASCTKRSVRPVRRSRGWSTSTTWREAPSRAGGRRRRRAHGSHGSPPGRCWLPWPSPSRMSAATPRPWRRPPRARTPATSCRARSAGSRAARSRTSSSCSPTRRADPLRSSCRVSRPACPSYRSRASSAAAATCSRSCGSRTAGSATTSCSASRASA